MKKALFICMLLFVTGAGLNANAQTQVKKETKENCCAKKECSSESTGCECKSACKKDCKNCKKKDSCTKAQALNGCKCGTVKKAQKPCSKSKCATRYKKK